MSVWVQKMSDVWPFENALTPHYNPRAQTVYVCTEHRMLIPVPADRNLQKLITIYIRNQCDTTFCLVPVKQSTIQHCFANEPQPNVRLSQRLTSYVGLILRRLTKCKGKVKIIYSQWPMHRSAWFLFTMTTWFTRSLWNYEQRAHFICTPSVIKIVWFFRSFSVT